MSNYVTDFCSKYVGILNKTNNGSYADNGAEYHTLLDTYDELVSSIDNCGELEKIRESKKRFLDALEKAQNNVRKAWSSIECDKKYPEQHSIHGLNLVIETIGNKIAEAEKL